MSLAQSLTPARLADLAAWAYERGVRYFEQGRVASWQAASANEVTGVVMGSDEYTARLYTNGKQIGYDCTCPAADRGAACKHVVALGLAYLSEQRPAPASTGPVFATREALEAFATEHHVAHALQATGEVLAEDFGALGGDAATGTAVWAEERRLASGPRVEASLQLVPEAKLACTCKLAACTHMLALIDKLLAHDAPAIAEELLRPPWQRALAERAAVDRPKLKVEGWWQLEDEVRAPTLVPIVRKEKKRGGRTSSS